MQDMQDKQEWFFLGGGAQNIACLWKCNPLSIRAIGLGAKSPFRLMPKRMRRFFTGAATPRKSDGGGAPSLPWGARGTLSRRYIAR